nr:Hypothetical protein [Aeromonas sp.]
MAKPSNSDFKQSKIQNDSAIIVTVTLNTVAIRLLERLGPHLVLTSSAYGEQREP